MWSSCSSRLLWSGGYPSGNGQWESVFSIRLFYSSTFLWGLGKEMGKNGCVYPWGREERPGGAREGTVTSWRWWSHWWTQPLFALLRPLLKGGLGRGHALSTPPPPTLRSDDCVRHFKEEKKYINMYKYSFLTWMNLFAGCFFMQCWGTMFIFLLTWWTPSPLPSSVRWNKRPGCGAVWSQLRWERCTLTWFCNPQLQQTRCQGLLLSESLQTGRLHDMALIRLFIELFTWRGGKCDTLYRVSTVMSVSQPIWKQYPRSSRRAAEL